MVYPLGGEGSYVRWQFRVVEQYLVRSCLSRGLLLRRRPDGANDMSPGMTRQLDRTQSHGPRSPLHKHRASVDGPGYMHGAMTCDAGNAEACALLHRHVRG